MESSFNLQCCHIYQRCIDNFFVIQNRVSQQAPIRGRAGGAETSPYLEKNCDKTTDAVHMTFRSCYQSNLISNLGDIDLQVQILQFSDQTHYVKLFLISCLLIGANIWLKFHIRTLCSSRDLDYPPFFHTPYPICH